MHACIAARCVRACGHDPISVPPVAVAAATLEGAGCSEAVALR
jgi:hypothetical protein